ncbi:MAG: hypothetical protein NTY37_11555 [Methanothrix sp.]|nr:hypothetical protein [Methanothrix sp.]
MIDYIWLLQINRLHWSSVEEDAIAFFAPFAASREIQDITRRHEEPFISSRPQMSLMRKEFRSLISLEEAQSIVQSRLPHVTVESVPLPEARGRILDEKVVSSLDVPGFSRASMDGFALRAEDTLAAREDRPVSLRLAGSVPMGVLPELRVAQGEAVYFIKRVQ